MTNVVYNLVCWINIVPISLADVPVHKKAKRQQILQLTKNPVRMNANTVTVNISQKKQQVQPAQEVFRGMILTDGR